MLIAIPAERGSAGPMPPFHPLDDDRDDDADAADAVVPPATAERPKNLFDRLLEAICKPGEPDFNNP